MGNSSSREKVKAPFLTIFLEDGHHLILFTPSPTRPTRQGDNLDVPYGVIRVGDKRYFQPCALASQACFVDSHNILEIRKDATCSTELQLACPAINAPTKWLSCTKSGQLLFTTKDAEGTSWRFGGRALESAVLVNVRKGGPSFNVRIQRIWMTWYLQSGEFWEPKQLRPYALAPSALQGLDPLSRRRSIENERCVEQEDEA